MPRPIPHSVHGGQLFAEAFAPGEFSAYSAQKKRQRASVRFAEHVDCARLSPLLSRRIPKLQQEVIVPPSANAEATWLLTTVNVKTDSSSTSTANLNLNLDATTGVVVAGNSRHGTLQAGDRILAIDGTPCASADVLSSLPQPPAFVHFFVHREHSASGHLANGSEGQRRGSTSLVAGLLSPFKRSKSVGDRMDSMESNGTSSQLGGSPPLPPPPTLSPQALLAAGLGTEASGAEASVTEAEASSLREAGGFGASASRRTCTLMRFVHCDDALRMRFAADHTIESLNGGGGRGVVAPASHASAPATDDDDDDDERSESTAEVSDEARAPSDWLQPPVAVPPPPWPRVDVRTGDRLLAINGSNLPADEGVATVVERLAREREQRRGGVAGRKGLMLFMLERPTPPEDEASASYEYRSAGKRAAITAQLKQFQYQLGRKMDERRTSLCRGGREVVLAQRLANDLQALALRESAE